MKKWLPVFFSLLFLASCTDEPKSARKGDRDEIPYVLSAPGNNQKLIIGEALTVKGEWIGPGEFSALRILIDDSLMHEIKAPRKLNAQLNTKDWGVGYHRVQLVWTNKAGEEFVENRTVILFSDLGADLLVAEIVKEFPHTTTNYTQGFEYYKGRLYESTGQRGQSILAEINPANGQIIRKVDVPDYIFGEGITVLNDLVYQITWEARKCFVYDVNTFEKKKEFQYFGEGWGLANDGTHIIMSNGSSELVFRDPKTFEKVRSIHVFGTNQEYVSLNELEYHDGAIYANVYQENFILKIDPRTGKVLAKIDCIDVVRKGKGSGDVLNGITYNAKTGNFLLTGKNWPLMFEVRFVEPK
jgi:glutaminyl-peptide cyclotransferase